MFGRRVPVKYVLLFSILAAVVCAALAVHYGLLARWLPTAIWGVLAAWFAVDAARSWSWQQKK